MHAKDKEEKRATSTRFNLTQGSHQTVSDKVEKEQATWDGRKRPIQSATRNLNLLRLNRKE